MLKIDKKSYKDKKVDHCDHIYSVNPLYLRINHANGYIEEKGVSKHLFFDSIDENRELLKKYNDALMELGTKSKKYAVMSVIMKKIT